MYRDYSIYEFLQSRQPSAARQLEAIRQISPRFGFDVALLNAAGGVIRVYEGNSGPTARGADINASESTPPPIISIGSRFADPANIAGTLELADTLVHELGYFNHSAHTVRGDALRAEPNP